MAIIMIIAMSFGGEPHVPRCLDLARLLARRSVFLFGPRQTGKSTYVRRQLAGTVELSFSLLDQGLLTDVLADPTRIRKEIAARDLRDTVICIDEIQKCPALMDEVHLMIEERGIRFLLTGSSARALKRKGVNMLGGRGSDRVMHPFSWFELGKRFSLDRAINHGLLPPHYLSDDPDEGLASYVDRYLTEEIAAEGLARNLPRFARFLQTAATTNAQMLNYSNVARDAQVPRQTVVQWYEVLRDTLIAFELPAWSRTVKRKAIETAKFYFFDTGVVRALRRLPPVSEASADFGEFFEHLVFLELRAWIDYRRPRTPLAYWRSRSGYEVDFILDDRIAIEVKATRRVQQKHLRSLRALDDERLIERPIVVCREERPRIENGIEIWPLEFFLAALWNKGL
ncbi:MAG: ATP-binding protein [Acidobacteria bacterium]|nr:ATP-binding protein [Acidobacteriota bacterium]